MTFEEIPTQEAGSLCSLISRVSYEQIYGTATQSKVWFLLEYPRVFGSKAVDESNLPETVKAYFDAQTKSTPGSRVQLIKKGNSSYPKEIHFYICLTCEEKPQIFEFKVSNYTELLELDFQKIIANPDDYANSIRQAPLYLICTNGKRDPCCLKFGFSFYISLHKLEPENTWQTSHVGGHRFATNLVCFPHGLFYGRLGDEDVQEFLKTYRRGELLLENYRGRSCYPEAVQAAEYYLRVHTGVREIPAFSLENVYSMSEDRWEVLFLEKATLRKHRLVITGVPSDMKVLKSCRDLEKSEILQYRLEAYQVLES